MSLTHKRPMMGEVSSCSHPRLSFSSADSSNDIASSFFKATFSGKLSNSILDIETILELAWQSIISLFVCGTNDLILKKYTQPCTSQINTTGDLRHAASFPKRRVKRLVGMANVCVVVWIPFAPSFITRYSNFGELDMESAKKKIKNLFSKEKNGKIID